jgi:hypothetical protein
VDSPATFRLAPRAEALSPRMKHDVEQTAS